MESAEWSVELNRMESGTWTEWRVKNEERRVESGLKSGVEHGERRAESAERGGE